MYNASKYAVRGFTEALREEMLIAGHPVGVTAVHPGGIKTAIARNGRYSDREDAVESTAIFDEKLATMTPERAAEIIVAKGVLGGKARRAGRPRRPRPPPLRPAHRLPLPGRRRLRRQAHASPPSVERSPMVHREVEDGHAWPERATISDVSVSHR